MSKSQKIAQSNPETREKQRKAMLGHIVSRDTKEKIRQSNLGKKRSYETRQKISRARRKKSLMSG